MRKSLNGCRFSEVFHKALVSVPCYSISSSGNYRTSAFPLPSSLQMTPLLLKLLCRQRILWFCDSHDLKINPEKTQLIIFKKPTKSIPEDFHLTLDNCIIKPQNTVKLLGVTLDQHLTFGPHIDSISMVNRMLNFYVPWSFSISKKCQALLVFWQEPHLIFRKNY